MTLSVRQNQCASLRDTIDSESTGSGTASKGLAKRDGSFDFSEGKQHQREGGMRDGPQQCSSFPAQCSCKENSYSSAASQGLLCCAKLISKRAPVIHLSPGIKCKESPGEDSKVGVPDSAICGSTQI